MRREAAPSVLGEPRSDDSRLFRLFDMASVFAFVALQVWGWTHVTAGVDFWGWSGLLLGLSSLVVSWMFADLASGIVHFAADHFGNERTPLLGKFIISTFRQHHETPRDMLTHGFFERNGNCALIALVAIFWIPLVETSTWSSAFLAMTALLVGLWTLGTNQFHAWAHAAQRPKWVSLLQKARIILPPNHHAVHHAPFEGPSGEPDRSRAPGGNYCITHGNCEFLLRALLGWHGKATLGAISRPHHDLALPLRGANPKG